MTLPATGLTAASLHVARADGLSAADCLATSRLLGPVSVGLLASPTRYQLVRVEDGHARTPHGPADLDGVFTLRVFQPAGELRWAQRTRGRGDAALLSETAITPPGWDSEPAAVIAALDGQYALWGRVFLDHPDVAGWCQALEGRIGSLDLPVPAPGPAPTEPPGRLGWPAAYLALRVREYVGRNVDGNASVREERLLAIVPAAPEFGPAPADAGEQP